MTVTPSERHSGLALRFARARRNDPGLNALSTKQFKKWMTPDAPSLYKSEDSTENKEKEEVTIYLPEYDVRRTLTARYPLCCVHAFQHAIQHVMPSLYGSRTCPECPHCNTSTNPCMNIFGSNATPMGGSLGRADAVAGAIEAQKTEGVLHLHFFKWVQSASQHMTLHEIAENVRAGLLKVDACKAWI